MTHRHTLAHALLWATAILASASLHAPPFLTLILLPALAATALLVRQAPLRQPGGAPCVKKT